MSIISNPKERQRFLKFAVVGIIGAVIDFGVFNLLVHFHTMRAVYASIISFTMAVISNFVWNRYWTYPDSRSKPVRHQLSMFALINVIGLGIRTPLFAFLENRLIWFFKRISLPRIGFIDNIFLGHNIALAIAILVVMFWNFYVNRYLTYNDVST
ncbi:MAG: GtrA family protein [Anaerolineales bacterium]